MHILGFLTLATFTNVRYRLRFLDINNLVTLLSLNGILNLDKDSV